MDDGAEVVCTVSPVLGTDELPDTLYYHSAELVRDNLALVICGSSEKGVIHHRTLVYELSPAPAPPGSSTGAAVRWSVKLQTTIQDGALRKRYSPATATFPRPAGGWYAVLFGGATDKLPLDTQTQKALGDADLRITHEKRLHMFVYDRALREFQHVHPMTSPEPNEGILHTTFPAAGDYRLWIQFKDGGELKVVPLSVTVHAR